MKRILVAEDDLAIRTMEERILSAAGYEVVVVSDGHEALGTLRGSNPPDLALVDMMMPGLGGLELSREMKADEKLRDIPIIFVTARTDAEAMNEGFKAGGVLYLTKPFTSHKLLELVSTVIDG